MASAVDSRLAYARLSAVATASRLPTATRGSNNSYTTSWDTTRPWRRRGKSASPGMLSFSVQTLRSGLAQAAIYQAVQSMRLTTAKVRSQVSGFSP